MTPESNSNDCTRNFRIGRVLLKAKDAKTKKNHSEVPICDALLEPLRQWLDLRTAEGTLRPTDRLFNVPKALDKVLNHDLIFAGIEKKDRRDRVIDVHAIRHTHATLLKEYGVDAHVAMKSMRHSDIGLTMNVYTHSELPAIAKGVNRLPDMLGGEKQQEVSE